MSPGRGPPELESRPRINQYMTSVATPPAGPIPTDSSDSAGSDEAARRSGAFGRAGSEARRRVTIAFKFLWLRTRAVFLLRKVQRDSPTPGWERRPDRVLRGLRLPGLGRPGPVFPTLGRSQGPGGIPALLKNRSYPERIKSRQVKKKAPQFLTLGKVAPLASSRVSYRPVPQRKRRALFLSS